MTFGYAWRGSWLVARRRRARGSWLLARRGSITYVVSVYVLPEIGIPRLKTDSEVAVTALSEGFSPLAVLTLRLESLPYQRADTRLVVFISSIGASGDFFVFAFFEA